MAPEDVQERTVGTCRVYSGASVQPGSERDRTCSKVFEAGDPIGSVILATERALRAEGFVPLDRVRAANAAKLPPVAPLLRHATTAARARDPRASGFEATAKWPEAVELMAECWAPRWVWELLTELVPGLWAPVEVREEVPRVALFPHPDRVAGVFAAALADEELRAALLATVRVCQGATGLSRSRAAEALLAMVPRTP